MVIAGEYSDEGFSGKNIQGRHEFHRCCDVQDCKDTAFAFWYSSSPVLDAMPPMLELLAAHADFASTRFA